MPRYVVRFLKDVLGENGRKSEVCQGTLEVDASSEGHATELAKQRFARRRHFATGRCTLTGFMSAPQTFRREALVGVQAASGPSIFGNERPRLSATALLVMRPR